MQSFNSSFLFDLELSKQIFVLEGIDFLEEGSNFYVSVYLNNFFTGRYTYNYKWRRRCFRYKRYYFIKKPFFCSMVVILSFIIPIAQDNKIEPPEELRVHVEGYPENFISIDDLQ